MWRSRSGAPRRVVRAACSGSGGARRSCHVYYWDTTGKTKSVLGRGRCGRSEENMLERHAKTSQTSSPRRPRLLALARRRRRRRRLAPNHLPLAHQGGLGLPHLGHDEAHLGPHVGGVGQEVERALQRQARLLAVARLPQRLAEVELARAALLVDEAARLALRRRDPRRLRKGFGHLPRLRDAQRPQLAGHVVVRVERDVAALASERHRLQPQLERARPIAEPARRVGALHLAVESGTSSICGAA